MNSKSVFTKNLNWLILPILVLVGALYYQILEFDFLLNFDDDMLILNSEEYKTFNWDHLKLIFGSFKEGLYHPLTSLSWMMDYAIWGQDAYGFHLSNLILHLLNCLLVYGLVRSISKSIEIALIAALFFGIHPMHVENIAWLASRKDLMLAVFFLLSLWTYQLFSTEGKKLHYWLSLLFAIMAMMSKVSAIVLPFLFILLDWFNDKQKWKGQLMNKLPYLIPAAVLVYVNFQAQKEFGYIREMAEGVSSLDQFFFVSYSAFYYLLKLCVPLELSPKNLYPDAGIDALPWIYYLSIVILIALVIVGIKWRNSRPLIFFALTYYLITIAPNLKIIPTGNDIVSNRYAYLAFLGIYMLIAASLPKAGKIGKYALLLIITVFWSKITYTYASTYRDSRSVWTAVIDAHQDREFGLAMALNERGQVAYKQGKLKLAATDYDRALSTYPDLKRGLYNRAILKEESGDYEVALKDLNRLINLEDSNVLALNLRSTVLGKMGQLELAISDLEEAEKYVKDDPKLYNNMGIIQSMQGEGEAARVSFKKAIEIDSEMLQARINLGRSFLDDQEYDSAIVQLSMVYQDDRSIFFNSYLLAKTYFKISEADKANSILRPFAEDQKVAAQIGSKLYLDSLYEQSLKYFNIAIGDEEIRNKSLYQRAQVYRALGDTENAIDDLLAIIEKVPNGVFFYELGLLYLELDNLSEACRFFDEAAKRKVKEAFQKQADLCGS